MDVAPGTHVPDTGDTVAAAGNKDIEGRVEGEGVDAAQMAMVMADNFVGFQIPAFDHLVLPAGEEVGMAR